MDLIVFFFRHYFVKKKTVIWTASVPRFPLNTKRENRKFGIRSKFSLGLDLTQSFKFLIPSAVLGSMCLVSLKFI